MFESICLVIGVAMLPLAVVLGMFVMSPDFLDWCIKKSDPKWWEGHMKILPALTKAQMEMKYGPNKWGIS